MAIITEIEDVFTEMLVNSTPFTDALRSGDDPYKHVIWMSTFEEEIEVERFRPFAICINTPFGATRTTEGSDDLSLYDTGIYMELHRNHADFNTDDPQVSRRQFKEWYGAIHDDLQHWRQTNMRFLRFANSSISADACRTELAKRETEEDFWAVGLHFTIDGGASE